MKVKVTPKEYVEQTLRFARWFAEKHLGESGASSLLDQLDDLETFGYDTGQDPDGYIAGQEE